MAPSLFLTATSDPLREQPTPPMVKKVHPGWDSQARLHDPKSVVDRERRSPPTNARPLYTQPGRERN